MSCHFQGDFVRPFNYLSFFFFFSETLNRYKLYDDYDVLRWHYMMMMMMHDMMM